MANEPPAAAPEAATTERPGMVTLIWGTNVNVEDTAKLFKAFLSGYRRSGDVDPFYLQLLQELRMSGNYHLNIDCDNIRSFDETLYDQLIRYPQEVIPIFDLTVYTLSTELAGSPPDRRFQVRPFNLFGRDRKQMRDLNPSDIDRLISLTGMVTRLSTVVPDMKEGFFRCLICSHTMEVVLDRGMIDEPHRCEQCGAEHSMSLIHNRCRFADKQFIRFQETPDAIPEGETPHTVALVAFDDLVDFAKPGDRCEVTGIFRAAPIRPNSQRRSIKSVYRTFIDVVHIRKNDPTRISVEDHTAESTSEYFASIEEGDPLSHVTSERIDELKRLSQTSNIYERLMKSMAPNIFEMDDVKKGILCQLLGGVNKEFTALSGRFRGEINVLLVGDPAVAKSQLLQYVHKIAPRGIFTSGKGSSAVGLTAYVTRDPETKEFVLESGALVLSDRGICCIDEFDKMSDSTRAVLHEVMEQQTVSVAKAGIIASLNARTSVLAAANPVESRYNPHMSVVENIRLPPTLLSRFDLIYLVLDKADEVADRRLARHLVSMYYREVPRTAASDALLDVKTLAQYISYARRFINPRIGDAAMSGLVNGYVEMRRLGNSKKVITATPRQLESLIRLSEALARMRFADVVEASDVNEAIRLVRAAMQQSAMDPRTGQIDMDLITTGHSAAERTELAGLVQHLRQWLGDKPAGEINFRDAIQAMSEETGREVSAHDMRQAFRQLQDEEIVVIGGEHGSRVIKR